MGRGIPLCCTIVAVDVGAARYISRKFVKNDGFSNALSYEKLLVHKS